MISDRASALLQAAATIYAGFVVAGDRGDPEGRAKWSVDVATSVLREIEAREPKPESREVPRCTCERDIFTCARHVCSCEVIGDNHLCPIHGG